MNTHTIFDWLDSVRQRPKMYANSIKDLHAMVYGYYAALQLHGIRESVPDMTDKFSIWAWVVTGWSGFNCGWGYAFDEHTPPNHDRFEHLFSYIDQYRNLTPTVVATVQLRPEHQPTGKRCVIGHNGRMERPDEISVVNYAPTSLYHLRHLYGKREVDDWFIMLGDGSYLTKLADAIDWVANEFNVDPSLWKTVA